MKKSLDLPRVDRDGRCYLSYSQIQSFLKDKGEYFKRYILGETFEGNAYTDFGSKVGNALEVGDFSDFDKQEQETLKKCERLDNFEERVTIDFGEFYVLGFIDTSSSDHSKIIDYKTGGKGKHVQYGKPEYTQLCYYALAIRQEYGITPTSAQVNFIRRDGNAFRGDLLSVGDEMRIIDVDISEDRLKKVYWETITIAKSIEEFYIKNKQS